MPPDLAIAWQRLCWAFRQNVQLYKCSALCCAPELCIQDRDPRHRDAFPIAVAHRYDPLEPRQPGAEMRQAQVRRRRNDLKVTEQYVRRDLAQECEGAAPELHFQCRNCAV